MNFDAAIPTRVPVMEQNSDICFFLPGFSKGRESEKKKRKSYHLTTKKYT